SKSVDYLGTSTYTISFDEKTKSGGHDYYLPNNIEQLDLYYEPFIKFLE
ncbi:MAG: hypothetical protein ACI85O_000991, partial [Saprospiraceae bacterium]